MLSYMKLNMKTILILLDTFEIEGFFLVFELFPFFLYLLSSCEVYTLYYIDCTLSWGEYANLVVV